MLPHKHLIITALFALFLFLIFPSVGILESLILIAFGFFVDVDHYLFYTFKKKDFSLIRAYKWFLIQTKKLTKMPLQKRKKTYLTICFFHGFELIILFLLLGLFIHRYFLFAFLGLLIHFTLDMYDHFRFYKTRFYRISILYGIFALKKLKFIDS
jgi:hypothetical protein